jgi:hypothetical protein
MLDVGSGGGSPRSRCACVPSISLLMVESKTAKSCFCAKRSRCELEGAEVRASRFEELLTRPELHEAHDLVTIRAVRIEPRVLSNLQAFLKTAGSCFCFAARRRPTRPKPFRRRSPGPPRIPARVVAKRLSFWKSGPWVSSVLFHVKQKG